MLAVALLVPMILWVVPRQGALGAAWVWIGLNAGYIVLNVGLMHRRLLTAEKWRWYGQRRRCCRAWARRWRCCSVRISSRWITASRGVWLAYLCGAYLAALSACALTIRDYRMRMIRLIVSGRRVVNP